MRNLYNIQQSLLAGDTAETNIAVTGALTTDHVLRCFHLSTVASIATIADITSEVSFTSAGNIQLSATDTSDDQLWLFWAPGGDGVQVPRNMGKLKMNLLAGAAADTNIAVSGITTSDVIEYCIHISTAASVATFADITSEVVILSAGNVQLTDTATTNDQLLLFWTDIDARCRPQESLEISLLSGAAADTNISLSGADANDFDPIFCAHISTAADVATIADITSEVVCLSANNIQLTDTATTNDQLLLFWNKTSD